MGPAREPRGRDRRRDPQDALPLRRGPRRRPRRQEARRRPRKELRLPAQDALRARVASPFLFFPSRDGSPRFEGGHNSTRPKIFLERAKTFIYLRLRLDRSPFGRDIRDHAKEVATPTEATVASRPKLAEISNWGRSSSAGATPAKKAAYGCLSPSYAHRGPPKASLSVSL